MYISVSGLEDERFIRPLQLNANLFFEETSVVFAEKEDAELNLKFALAVDPSSAEIKGVLTDQGGQELFSEYKAQLPAIGEKDRFKQIKNAVVRVQLLLLEEWTGITQKWGILNGVRPTKLLHRKMQEKVDREIAHQGLHEKYLISREKIALMQEIVDRQLKAVPDLYELKKEVSIYIGIPFCPTKCAYCTFPAYAINGRQGSVDSFLGGLHYEMRKVGNWLKEHNVKITTVYFGGGTPTSITAEEMDLLYEEMHQSFPNVEKIREITVEAGRPDTITPEKLKVMQKWGIDRISVNPQSFIQETLKAIGRHHTVVETKEKFQLARDMGMNNINMDLIIGLPGEGLPEFTYTLDEIEKLMPESLTVHTLSFKRASEMTKHKEKYKVADRNEIGKMMDLAEAWTKTHGYFPYYLYRQKNILGNLENVGYTLEGQESIYNIMIMEEQQTILGLGCGASSKFIHPETGEITHFANPKDPKSYHDSYEHYADKKIKVLTEIFG
ncbi:coproporphyrinogen III oxidase [Bacillus benzoevorans]|uniref:Oxygen-independent coproporphyrinogen-3 oxidase n=1 Tax=Bacillus benzoevorans TaxID=1456 RepID=A0A7X0LTG4_9BACI|nr:coproporphyrinogen III oxidase [Bacillus benzoevorans]MBB6443458.1 oxygen-independent coproporphyrinogen-3 oxidase [Bacillus benzoevorans]